MTEKPDTFGYAFSSDAEERMKADLARAKEVHDKVEIETRTPAYAHTKYTGRTLEEGLSDRDVALACDSNLCFGFRIRRSGDRFWVDVHTD